MNTDLEYDDELGQRMRAFRSWEPVADDASAWRGVEKRRRRVRVRRVAAGTLALAVAFAALGVVIDQTAKTGKHLSVVNPATPITSGTLAQPLPVAPIAAIDISPTGPYQAGQTIRVTYKPSRSAATPSLNPGVSVCYAWGHGETCDPTVHARLVDTNAEGVDTYELTVPGWVYTPTGLQSCSALHCRFEIENADGARIGTPPVEVAAGPEPQTPARIDTVGDDQPVIDVSVDGMKPDPSWTQWSTTVDPATVAKLPPGAISICAFAARLLCDGLVHPNPPPFDGQPHELTVNTNRLLLTPAGWIDCEKVVCMLAITRTVDVASINAGDVPHEAGTSAQPVNRSVGIDNHGRFTRSDTQTIAVLPYQLPSTVPPMAQPTLSYTPAGPFYLGDTVTATLHNPPANVDPDAQLVLARCSGADLHAGGDCTGEINQTWSKLPDGDLQQRTPLSEADPNGIYLAVGLPGLSYRGYPNVASTDPFTVTLTPAEQKHVDSTLKRLHIKKTSP